MIFIAILFASCTSDKESNNVIIARQIEFHVLDNQGNDLLNPQIQSNFNNIDKIKLYHIINGEAVLFDRPNLDFPKGYLIYKRENEDIYRINLTVNPNGNTTTTLVEWNSNDTDTIKCDLNNYDYNSVISKVWYNGVLKYDGVGESYFEVVK